MNDELERLAAHLARAPVERPIESGPRSAVAALLRVASPGDSKLDVLLMKRIEREGDRWSGQISLPGGHHDEGDQDLLATSIRETREEVGVDLAESASLLGHLSPLAAKVKGRVLAMRITPFVFAQVQPAQPHAGVEAEEVFWFPISRGVRGELDTVHAFEHEGRRRELPAWRFHGHVVWGLTREILTSLGRAGGLSAV